MMKKEMVPDIRFEAFNDEWEEKPISDIATVAGGGTPSSAVSEYWNGQINWFTPTEVDNNGYLTDSIRKITDKGLEKSSAKLLPAGTVLMTSRAGVGKMAILTTESSTNQGFQSLVPNNGVISYFLYTLQPKISKNANRLASGSTFTEISGKELGKIKLFIPLKEEQTQIGSLFQHLDDLIAANQRKGDQLQQLKQALLQKLFPAGGSTVPAIRFAGFTDEWEEKRLGDVIFSQLKGKAKAEMAGNESEYLDTARLNGGPALTVASKSDVDKNDVLILWDGSQAGTVYYGFEGALGSTLKAYKPKYSGGFLFQYLKKNQKLIFDRYRTANIPHVIRDFSERFLISVPSENEQLKVSHILENVDKLIASNSSKQKALEELKKSLIQKMFV